MHAGTKGRGSNLMGAWTRLRASLGESPGEVRGGCGWLQLTLGTYTLVADTLGNIQRHEQCAKTWFHPTACRH